MGGALWDLFAAAANRCNLTFRPECGPNDDHGRALSLLSNFDIIVGAVTITRDRATRATFSAPVLDANFEFVVREAAVAVDPFGFVRPFSSELWGVALASVAAFCVVAVAIEYSSPFSDLQAKNSVGENDGGGAHAALVARDKPALKATPLPRKVARFAKNIIRTFFYALTLMMGRGEVFLHGISGRVLAVGVMFCMLVLVSLYTANLTAMMTSARTVITLRSLDDVSRALGRIAVINGTSTQKYMFSSTLPSIVRLRGSHTSIYF